MRRHVVIALVLVGAALGIAGITACGGDKNASATTGSTISNALPDDLGDIADLSGKKEVTVEVPDNSFSPRAFKVSPGTKVTFKSTGANAHNVTPNEDGAFPYTAIKPGESAVVVAPDKPGTYRFYCTIHGGKNSGQRGAMIVTA